MKSARETTKRLRVLVYNSVHQMRMKLTIPMLYISWCRNISQKPVVSRVVPFLQLMLNKYEVNLKESLFDCFWKLRFDETPAVWENLILTSSWILLIEFYSLRICFSVITVQTCTNGLGARRQVGLMPHSPWAPPMVGQILKT